MRRVFISYSRRNKTFAERLARDLDDAGLEVWIDFRQITAGELWQQEIYRGIERSEFIIYCMSPASVESVWCNKEVAAAREQDKLILPIMVVDAYDDLQKSEDLSWILNVHFINFVERYEQAFPELLEALPGARPVGVYDVFDPDNVQNPFKGLEAFQQTDSHFFFGREQMIQRSLKRIQETRFLALVGASGSGKSSLVRAGILPAIRDGKIPHSETWRTAIMTPGSKPLESLVTRIMPYLEEDETRTNERVIKNIQDPEIAKQYVDNMLADSPPQSRLLIVIDQFEEVFTRATEAEAQPFIDTIVKAVNTPDLRIQLIATMRADFFGNLSRYPRLAPLFEQEHMIIVTDMTAANIRRAIEGPVQAVGLQYEDGLVDRILDDVRAQPGSLPLLQYALRQLFDKRDGLVLTHDVYDEIGGVRRALAQHAEEIFSSLDSDQQEVTRRLLLRLVEVGDSGEATRRKVPRSELTFEDIEDATVEQVINLLTAADSRLLIASRQIRADGDEAGEPITWIEVSHEALIREWDRFKTWVSSRLEDLQYNTELRKLAQDWESGGRDVAYLLVGKRLTRAEVWIEDADANELQREFIAASLEARHERQRLERERQEAELEMQRKNTARFRLLSIFLVIGFVGSLIGFVITVNQRNELEVVTDQLQTRSEELQEQTNALEEQSIILEQTADESQSLALAAEADRAFIDRDIDLAITLALQATGIDNPPIRTQSTLNDIALAAGTRRVIPTPNLTIESMAYNSDASRLVTGLDNGEIIIWEVATGNELLRWQAHDGTITSVDYSPDDSQIVSGSGGTQDTLRVWNAETGELIINIPYHDNRVTDVVFSPDGQFFISGSIDRRYVIWSSSTFTPVYSAQLENDITYIEVSTIGDDWIIAVADTDQVVVVNQAWDIITAITPASFDINENITAIRMNASGDLLMVGFNNGEIGLWNPRDGSPVQTFPTTDTTIAATAVDFLPRDDKIIAGFADGTMRIWDVLTSRQTDVFNLEKGIRDLAVNQQQVRMTVSQEGQMRIWDIQGSAEIRRFTGHTSQVSAVAYHPDGEHILSGSFDTTLILWDTATGQPIRSYEGHEGNVVALAFNADGSRFISGSNDKTARIWDTETGEILQTLTGHQANVSAVAWHPSSSVVATGAFDNRIMLWDADTGEQLAVLEGHTKTISSLEFNADGSLLLSSSFDNTLIIWDMETNSPMQTFTGHASSVFAGGFNADSTQIISGSVDRTVRLWDVASGREIRRFEGHDRVINQVAFIADSNAAISASSDGTLRLWDADSGLEVYRYTVENNFGRAVAMRTVALKADGRKAITGMADSTVRQWEILPTMDSLVRWTLDNRFIRTLDCTEQITFGLQETLDFDQQVFISSGDEPTLDLLFDPTQGAVTGTANNGESVDLIDTQTLSNDDVFFQVCTATGQVGWVADDALDGLSPMS